MRRQEIKKTQKLLDKHGIIAEPGYAKKLIWEYDRSDIIIRKNRIKEWDYYYIGNDDFALCLTVADMGYIGAYSVSVIDFKENWQITKSKLTAFPRGKMKMPASTIAGDVKYSRDGFEASFINDGKKTHYLIGEFPAFGNNKEKLVYDIKLTDTPPESMVIATPFQKKGYFYLNQKINCMNAEGSFTIGDKTYTFSRETNSMSTLDWGRGVWTYNNTWYWASLQTRLEDGKTFGLNLGYGFGANHEDCTENAIFYGGKNHKLHKVTFNIPQKKGKDDFMSPWTITSNNGRLELEFVPIIDRFAPVNLGAFAMIPHQVFGKFSGKAILDNGTEIEIKDVMGFAEKVHNKW